MIKRQFSDDSEAEFNVRRSNGTTLIISITLTYQFVKKLHLVTCHGSRDGFKDSSFPSFAKYHSRKAFIWRVFMTLAFLSEPRRMTEIKRGIGQRGGGGKRAGEEWGERRKRETKSERKFFFIAVPTATILGGPELYVGAGSTINLTCAIRFSSEPPAYIFWYYNENVLSYDSPRGGVSVITEKGGDVTTSWLLIQTAQTSDSGEYSCKPSNANTASIRVHVLNGESLLLWVRQLRPRRRILRATRDITTARCHIHIFRTLLATSSSTKA